MTTRKNNELKGYQNTILLDNLQFSLNYSSKALKLFLRYILMFTVL